ncbi:MAG: GNAT family N-acetyltransferase [Pseudomonadota bacterium]
MDDTIRTARLTLRRLEMRDAQALHTFFIDPVAMEHWSKPHQTFEETKEWVRGTLSAPEDATREYVLELAGSVIGKAGMWKRPEVGYFLARDYWGEGLMTEALTTLLPVLHKVMHAPTLTAEMSPENTASARVLSKVGFTEVKRGEKDYWDGEKWCDTVYYERHI